MLRPVAKKNLLFTEVFLELELKEGVGGLQVQKTLFHSSTGAGAGSSGWAWSGPVPHHPLLSLSVQGIKPTNHIFVPWKSCEDILKPYFWEGHL